MPYTIDIGTHVQRPYSLCSRVGQGILDGGLPKTWAWPQIEMHIDGLQV